MSWPIRAKELLKGLPIVLALVLALAAWAGVLALMHDRTCDRLNAERISHLEPGHETRGPGSTYVIGVGPGPPPSEIEEYWEAVAAMERAGCEVPGEGASSAP